MIARCLCKIATSYAKFRNTNKRSKLLTKDNKTR